VSKISDALKKDGSAIPLVQIDFDDWKLSVAEQDVSLAGSQFSGLVLGGLSIWSYFDFSSFRFSDITAPVLLANKERFQDIEAGRQVDRGIGTVFLWSKSLAMPDIEPFPLFRGSFRKTGHDKFHYNFEIVDYSNTMGRTIATMPAMEGSPADNIASLLLNQTNLTLDDIDMGSLGTMEAMFSAYNFSTQVTSETNAFNIVDRLLIQLVCGRKMIRGKLGIINFDMRGPLAFKLNSEDVLGRTVRVSSTAQEQVANDIYVQYNQSGGSWGSNMTIDYTNDDMCRRSRREYGPRPQRRLSLADVPDIITARACVGRFLQWRSHRHHILECTVPHHLGFDMREGVKAEWTLGEGPSTDGKGWVDEEFILVENSFTPSGFRQKWLRIEGC